MLKLDKPQDGLVQRIENEWHSNLFGFVDDCDRRINAAQRRLEKTPEENAKTTALVSLVAHGRWNAKGGGGDCPLDELRASGSCLLLADVLTLCVGLSFSVDEGDWRD